MDVVVDTDALSYIFKSDDRGEAYKNLIADFKYRCISFQTLAELDKWSVLNKWGLKRRAELHYFLSGFEVLHTDDQVCGLWARIIAEQNQKGRILKAEDAWIAANALDIKAPLITNNAKDFGQIEGLQVLTASVK